MTKIWTSRIKKEKKSPIRMSKISREDGSQWRRKKYS